MNNNCSPDPCGAPLNAHCVKFTAQELPCIGSTINDRLDDILINIDTKLCELEGVDETHIMEVICENIQDTPTIDLSCVDNVLQADLIVTLGDESLTDVLFWTGTEVKKRGLDTIVPQIQDIIGDIYDDSSTVDFTYDTILRRVTADVKISSSPGNGIVALLDGIWTGIMAESQLVYGGEVTWTGIGYIYDISAAGYYINFTFYESPAITVTLDPADPTYNRIDTYIVDTLGVASVLSGTASATPTEAPLNLATQLRLSATIVQANTLQPLDDQCIYQEGIEWLITEDATFDSLSTASPCFDSVSIEATSPQTGDSILFRIPSLNPFAVAQYGTLTLLVTSKGGWNDSFITIQWENFFIPVGSPVVISNAAYGFNELDTSECQMISIPINNFSFGGGDMADSLRITSTVGPTFDFGFYIDNICLTTEQIGESSINLYNFQNGLTQVNNTSNVEFGGQLLHDTTLSTINSVMNFRGAKANDYSYNFFQNRAFYQGTGITSFRSLGNSDGSDPDFNNLVALGVNYTGDTFRTSQPAEYIGFMDDQIGYWLGVNAKGSIQSSLKVEDGNSKISGMFMNTLDSALTDAITFFTIPAPSTTSLVDVSLGESLKPYRALTIHTDLDLQAYNYPDTRDDGLSPTNRFLSTDVDGKLKMYSVPISTSISSYRIDGGEIAWVANYDYNVSAANYVILGATHSSPETPITLDAADGTFDRIDLVVVDSDGLVQVITGDPSANPQNPSYDPTTQLPLSFILVATGTTQPACNTLTDVWLENAGTPSEWAFASTSGTIVVNTSFPRTGLNDINATAAASGAVVTFTPLATFTSDNMTQLDLYIRSKATWGPTATGKTLTVRFQVGAGVNIGSPVVIPPRGAFGWDSSVTGSYQQVIIPANLFGVPSGSSITSMTMTVGGGSATMGWNMDDIRIEKNCNVVVGANITADNGLTMSSASNVQLGGTLTTPSPLLHDSYINPNGFFLSFIGSRGATYIQDNAIAINSTSIANIPLSIGWTTGTPSPTPLAAFTLTPTSTNTILDVLELNRATTGTGANGIGSGLRFTSFTTTGKQTSNRIVSQWTNATNATRTSQLDIIGVNSTADTTIMSAYGSGVVGIGKSSAYAATRLDILNSDSTSANLVNMVSGSTGNYVLEVYNTSTGTGIYSHVGTGNAILASSTGSSATISSSSTGNSGVALSAGADGIGAKAIYAAVTGVSGVAGYFVNETATTNDVVTGINLLRYSTGADAVGIGTQIQYNLGVTDTSNNWMSNQIISKWTTATEAARTSQMLITGVSAAATANIVAIDGTGVVGIGITSSFNATRLHIVDNTLSTNLVRLESSASTSQVLIQGVSVGNTSGASFLVVNGAGVIGQASGSGIGVTGSSTTGFGMSASSPVVPISITNNNSATNSVNVLAQLKALTTGTAATGLGGSLDFYIETDDGNTGHISNQIITKWTDAALATRTSQFSITGVNSAITNTLVTVSGGGFMEVFANGSTTSAFRASAQAGGIAVTGQGGTSGGWFTGTGFGVEGGASAGIPILGTSTAASVTGAFPIIQIQNTANTPTIGDELFFRASTRITGGTTTAHAGVFGYKMLNVTSGTTASQFIIQTNSGTDTGVSTRFAVNSDGSWDITPITATQASAITPTEGKFVFVSNTNGTFTSIGLWCYENGAWSKK